MHPDNRRKTPTSAESKKVAPAEPPVVAGQPASRREVTDFVDFTGRTEAVHSVDIRPRVTGYLVKMPFQEGEEVKAGDLLFVVDPRPYKAQLDQAQGQVDLYQASAQAGQDHARARSCHQLACAGLDQPAAVRPGAGRGRGGRCPGEGLREEHGDLQAQPRVHPCRSRRSTARSAAIT